MNTDEPLRPGLEPLPGYRLLEPLGSGGYGQVWKAEAPGGLLKAIKFVHGSLDDPLTAAATKQELTALQHVKALRHPFLLSLERVEIVADRLLVVMELADHNLMDEFQSCQARGLPGIPRRELLRYLGEAAEVLDLMNRKHRHLHMDVKPQNLFLVHRHVKVGDFGLVNHLRGRRTPVNGGLTPIYGAPESFDNWVSPFSDQYSLAIVYQELLTGQRPFPSCNLMQLIVQHVQQPPNLKPLPTADRPIIGRALAKNPDERWRSCLEMVRALAQASEARPTQTVAPRSPKRAERVGVASATQLPDEIHLMPLSEENADDEPEECEIVVEAVCPSCEFLGHVPEHFANKQLRCRQCATVFRV